MNGIHGKNLPDDVHDAAALYAVDALEPDERAAFEEHLRDCAACRRDVAEFGEVGAHLAAGVEQDPPPQLRADVLAGIRSTRPLPADPAGTGDPSGTGEPPAEAPGATVVPLQGRRRPRRQWLTAVAAALVPIAALGGWMLGTQAEQRELEQLIAQEQDREHRLLSAPDVATHRLDVEGRPATLVVSRQRDAAVLVASDLPAPGEGREYQLWLMQDGTPVPDARFGGGETEVWLAGDVDRAGAVAMTVEPAGGSPAPTSPILASTEI